MKNSVSFSVALAFLSCLNSATTSAQNAQVNPNNVQGPGFTSDIRDPKVELQRAREKREQASTDPISLFSTSPLTPIRERGIAAEKRLYESCDIKMATNFNTLFQGLGDNRPGTDDFGMATFMSFVTTWDGWKKGAPDRGEITMGIDGRWNWGTTDPVALGVEGLGASGFTANPFNTYTPAFLVRNLFWHQGSREAGWMYRIGRVTPDAFFQTSAHITPLTTFTPIVGTGAFAMALPDSGLGMFAGVFVNDWMNIAGALTDANANRFNFGDPKEGDIFTAVELQVKLLPVTEKAGYSKVAFWYNEGTDDGLPANGSTGVEGWGVSMKLEQELSCDGRLIGIARWGKSYKDSALYEELASGHLVLYDPFNSGRYEKMGFNADVAGIAYNWIQPTGLDRDESNLETFYRFPLFPEMDATVSYQGIFNPAQDPSNEYGSAFSLRLRSTW